MYPLKFEPIFKTIVWGGEKIAPYKGVETEQEHIGESWELSGVKGNESVVANGALKGRTIADLVKEYKGRLVGEHVYANTGDEFPLLIKFIDALGKDRDVVCGRCGTGRAPARRHDRGNHP